MCLFRSSISWIQQQQQQQVQRQRLLRGATLPHPRRNQQAAARRRSRLCEFCYMSTLISCRLCFLYLSYLFSLRISSSSTSNCVCLRLQTCYRYVKVTITSSLSFRFRQIPTHPDYKLACSTEINGSLYRVISVSPTFTNLSATPTLLADPKNPGASSGKLLVNASHIDSYSSSSKKNAGAAAGAGLQLLI